MCWWPDCVPTNSFLVTLLYVLNCVILCVCRFLIVLGCLILAILTTFREHEKVSAHWLVILVRRLGFLGFVASQDQLLALCVAFKSGVFWWNFWFQLCEICTWNKWNIPTLKVSIAALSGNIDDVAASFLWFSHWNDHFKMNFCGFEHVSVLCFDLRWSFTHLLNLEYTVINLINLTTQSLE